MVDGRIGVLAVATASALCASVGATVGGLDLPFALLLGLAPILVYEIVTRALRRRRSVDAPGPPAPEPAGEGRARPRGKMILRENLVSLGRLAVGVAHEFGNPLTTISSIAQLLRRRYDEDPFVREQARTIETHVKRLSRLSRRLVDLAFPGRPTISEFDVHRSVRDTIEVARMDRRLRPVELEMDLLAAPLRVRADEGAVHLVLLNLLFNAADALDGSGRIAISTSRSDLGAEIRIADSGPGIPREIQSRVFAPFFTTKEAGRGTGLGLSISCRLARAMGGELNLESTGEGGSTFLLILDVPEAAA